MTKEYFISPAGSDIFGDGSKEHPWFSMEKVKQEMMKENIEPFIVEPSEY